jgi:hypothetical protein
MGRSSFLESTTPETSCVPFLTLKLIDLDALLAQSVDDRLWRRVEAEEEEGVADGLFHTGRAHCQGRQTLKE